MKFVLSALFAVVLFFPRSSIAAPIVIDFEDLNDSLYVGGSIPGLIFSNATVLTAGVSLNEFDLPPSSGSNVVFDDGGGIRIDFAAPVFSVGGYFNYYSPVTLQAFDAANNLLGSVSSLFSINAAGLGDPDSAPNELLQLAISGGAAYVLFTGDSAGGSFTLDDFSYHPEAPAGQPAPVPEPATLPLLATGAAVALLKRRPIRRGRCG